METAADLRQNQPTTQNVAAHAATSAQSTPTKVGKNVLMTKQLNILQF